MSYSSSREGSFGEGLPIMNRNDGDDDHHHHEDGEDEIIALLVVFQRTELMSTISTLHPKRDRGFQHVSALQKQAGPSYTSDHS